MTHRTTLLVGKRRARLSRAIQVEGVSQEDTGAEKDAGSSDYLNHRFAPWLEIPERAA